MYESATEAKRNGFFSRRHRTNEVHLSERENAKDRVARRKRVADTNAFMRSQMTDEDQLQSLRARGHGDCREALRLERRIAEAKAEARGD